MWNFTRVLIYLHKHCLWYLWQISRLLALSFRYLQDNSGNSNRTMALARTLMKMLNWNSTPLLNIPPVSFLSSTQTALLPFNYKNYNCMTFTTRDIHHTRHSPPPTFTIPDIHHTRHSPPPTFTTSDIHHCDNVTCLFSIVESVPGSAGHI